MINVLGSVIAVLLVVTSVAYEVVAIALGHNKLTVWRLVGPLLSLALACVWFLAHTDIIVILCFLIVQILIIGDHVRRSDSYARPPKLNLLSYLERKIDLRRQRASEMGITVRELLRRRDVMQAEPDLQMPFWEILKEARKRGTSSPH
jgi:hypothetical protein